MARYGFSPLDGRKLIELLAYELWKQRGCPIGSPEADYCAAERVLLAWVADSGRGLPYALATWNEVMACLESRALQ
jgi:hypothetical protein